MKGNTTKGFGLLQVLIIGSILSGVSMYMVRSSNVLLKRVRSAFYKEQLFIHKQTIEDALTDSMACQEMLGGVLVGDITPGNPLGTITGIGALMTEGEIFGPNDRFSLTNVRIGNPGGANVVTIEYDVTINDDVFGPSMLTRTIPLFGIVGGGAVSDCYFDPSDPDPYDANPDGVISQALANLCNSPTIPGASVNGTTLNTSTMTCNTAGFDPPAPAPSDTACPSGQVVAGLNYDPALHKFTVNCVANQYWLPGRSCAGNDMMQSINSDGSLNCTAVTIPQIDMYFNTADTTPACCSQSVQLLKVGGRLQLNCNACP